MRWRSWTERSVGEMWMSEAPASAASSMIWFTALTIGSSPVVSSTLSPTFSMGPESLVSAYACPMMRSRAERSQTTASISRRSTWRSRSIADRSIGSAMPTVATVSDTKRGKATELSASWRLMSEALLMSIA